MAALYSMIPKSGYRFSEQIMRRQKRERDDSIIPLERAAAGRFKRSGPRTAASRARGKLGAQRIADFGAPLASAATGSTRPAPTSVFGRPTFLAVEVRMLRTSDGLSVLLRSRSEERRVGKECR